MDEKGEVRKTNNAGGTLGGITAGRYLFPRGVQTGFDHEETAYGHTEKQEETEFEASGRHDPLLPRAVPIVDAMSALVIMDHYLRNKSQNG